MYHIPSRLGSRRRRGHRLGRGGGEPSALWEPHAVYSNSTIWVTMNLSPFCEEKQNKVEPQIGKTKIIIIKLPYIPLFFFLCKKLSVFNPNQSGMPADSKGGALRMRKGWSTWKEEESAVLIYLYY